MDRLRYRALRLAFALFGLLGLAACAASAPPPAQAPEEEAEVPVIAPEAAPEAQLQPAAQFQLVRVFYGTDRAPTKATEGKDAYFGGVRSTTGITYGTALVYIPSGHRVGELAGVTLESSANLAKPAWLAALAARIAQDPRKSELIYVHGYNVPFVDAARRAAQLSFDLKFPGATAFFSWPSEAELIGYPGDEGDIEWATPHLETFLRAAIAEARAENVYIVAHSMGARGISRALVALAEDDPAAFGRIKDVVLAAPDIDRAVFEEQILPRIGPANVTLYVSDRDKAIAASNVVHRYPRLGWADKAVLIAAGVSSIDASAVDTSFIGHSYYAEEPPVIRDIQGILDGTPPDRRKGLSASQTQSGLWVFDPPPRTSPWWVPW